MVPDLNVHGATIPKLGFGTWKLKGEECRKRVKDALDIGYRHVDTAQAYENEEEVGAAIAEHGVPREDIFVTTKVWMDKFADGDLQKSLRESLVRLKMDRVDLALLHWPNPDIDLEETIKALNGAREEGLTQHIGVSNFTTQWLGEATTLSDAPLVTNQCEYHPFIDQTPVLEACRKYEMSFTAYSPIAQAEVFGNDVLKDIARTHAKNEAQVALRWLVQQEDVIAIPRTSDEDHARTNFEVFDFELSEEEMDRIFDLSRPNGRLIDPEWAPAWDTAA